MKAGKTKTREEPENTLRIYLDGAHLVTAAPMTSPFPLVTYPDASSVFVWDPVQQVKVPSRYQASKLGSMVGESVAITLPSSASSPSLVLQGTLQSLQGKEGVLETRERSLVVFSDFQTISLASDGRRSSPLFPSLTLTESAPTGPMEIHQMTDNLSWRPRLNVVMKLSAQKALCTLHLEGLVSSSLNTNLASSKILLLPSRLFSAPRYSGSSRLESAKVVSRQEEELGDEESKGLALSILRKGWTSPSTSVESRCTEWVSLATYAAQPFAFRLVGDVESETFQTQMVLSSPDSFPECTAQVWDNAEGLRSMGTGIYVRATSKNDKLVLVLPTSLAVSAQHRTKVSEPEDKTNRSKITITSRFVADLAQPVELWLRYRVLYGNLVQVDREDAATRILNETTVEFRIRLEPGESEYIFTCFSIPSRPRL